MAKTKKSAAGKSAGAKSDQKQLDLNPDIETGTDEFMTTDQGLKNQ